MQTLWLFNDDRFVMLATRKLSIVITSLVAAATQRLGMVLVTICKHFWAGIEDEYSSNSHLQYVNSANPSPCDVIMKMADSREDGNQKLQIFAYLDVGVTTLSIIIGLYSWYCFIYWNKNFAYQWPFKWLPDYELWAAHTHSSQCIRKFLISLLHGNDSCDIIVTSAK